MIAPDNRHVTLDEIFESGGQAHASAGQEGPFYRIGDIARELDLSARALRFYEDKGLVTPKRAGSTRYYDRHQLTRLRIICFGRRLGFSVAELQELLDAWENMAQASKSSKTLLSKLSSKLMELEDQRIKLDLTIKELRSVLFRLTEKVG